MVLLIVQVTLVGIIRSVKEAATRLDYEVDDMTAHPLEVRQFVDNDVSLKVTWIGDNYFIKTVGFNVLYSP